MSVQQPVFFDAFTRIGQREGAHPAERWSVEHLRDEMKRCGISAALVAGQGEYSAQQGRIQSGLLLEPQNNEQGISNSKGAGTGSHTNSALYAMLADYPELYPVWTLAPDEEIPEADFSAVTAGTLPSLEQARNLAERGVLLILSAVGFPDLSEVSNFCNSVAGLNVLLHDIHFSRTRELPGLLKRASNLHLALTQANRFIEHITELGFEDRVLFASGAPQRSLGSMRAIVDWGDVSAETKQKMAGGNLARLLGMTLPEPVEFEGDELIAAARRGEPLPCTVLDMHAHILEEGQNGHDNLEMLNGGPSGTVELNRRIGINGVAAMSWVGPVCVDTENGNRHVREAIAYAPDFFRGLPTFDVREKSATVLRAEMEAIFSAPRMVGIKPYYAFGVPFDDPRYDPVWVFAQERGLYVGIHPTTFQMPKPEYQAREFDSICSRYPDLTVLAYHAGCSFEIADTVIELCRKYPNLYAEINYSSVPGGMIDYLVSGCGVERVLFGTDQVMRDPRPQLGWVVYSDLSEAEKRQVLGLNAERFFKERR